MEAPGSVTHVAFIEEVTFAAVTLLVGYVMGARGIGSKFEGRDRTEDRLVNDRIAMQSSLFIFVGVEDVGREGETETM